MLKWSDNFSPLGRRIVVSTVTFSTLVALIATALQLYVDYRRNLNDIESTFEQVELSYLPTISSALWTTKHDEVQTAIDGLAQLPDVRYVEVRENGKPWATAGQPKLQRVRSRDYSLKYLHRGETIIIGSLHVVVDMNAVYQRLIEKFWVIFITNSVKTFLVASFMLWMFYWWVTRHLRHIAEFASRLGSGNLEQRLSLARPVQRGAKPDEFDLVLSAFNQMQQNLAHSLNSLRDSEERYRTVADFTYDWEYWIAPDGSLPYVAPSCERLTGYNAEAFQRDPGLLITIVHPDDRQRVNGLLNVTEASNNQASREFDFRIRTRDGTERWLAHVDQPVYGRDGEYRGFRASNRDITERKLVSEKLEEKNAELERYSYMVSHDMKSPLVTIKTFLGYLREDMEQGDVGRIEKDMEFMTKAADKMNQLLDELLEMSRIGRIVSMPEHINWRTVVEEALNINAGAIAQRGVAVTVDEVDISLFGERPRLVQLWQNLIDNAVKFLGDQPAPEIHIGVMQFEQGLEFYIRDNGIGVDIRYHDKIFGIFEKLDVELAGSGLGLALVKRIVQLYQGEIRIESKGVGHGTCFRFTLPTAVNTLATTITNQIGVTS